MYGCDLAFVKAAADLVKGEPLSQMAIEESDHRPCQRSIGSLADHVDQCGNEARLRIGEKGTLALWGELVRLVQVIDAGKGVEWEEIEDPSLVLDLEVGLDGRGRLFCGRAAEEYRDRLLVIDVLVAGLTARFLAVMGELYSAGGYLGLVDVGMAVTDLRGGISYVLSRRLGVDPTPFNKDSYRRTERLSAPMLSSDPRGAARKLVLPLSRAITRESYDPFSE